MRDLFSSLPTQREERRKKNKERRKYYYQIAACIGKTTKFTTHSLHVLVDAWWGDISFFLAFKTRKQEYNTILKKVQSASRTSHFAMDHQQRLDESKSCGENIKLWDHSWDGCWRRPQGFTWVIANQSRWKHFRLPKLLQNIFGIFSSVNFMKAECFHF